jgi:hypothetical protein
MNVSTADNTVVIEATCTNFANVTITVPSAGRILVFSMAQLMVNHASVNDRVYVSHGNTSTSCHDSDAWAWIGDLSGLSIGANYLVTANVQSVFAVSAAGTYTYYLNGYMWMGQDPSDEFHHGNMVAVFYPD